MSDEGDCPKKPPASELPNLPPVAKRPLPPPGQRFVPESTEHEVMKRILQDGGLTATVLYNNWLKRLNGNDTAARVASIAAACAALASLGTTAREPFNEVVEDLAKMWGVYERRVAAEPAAIEAEAVDVTDDAEPVEEESAPAPKLDEPVVSEEELAVEQARAALVACTELAGRWTKGGVS